MVNTRILLPLGVSLAFSLLSCQKASLPELSLDPLETRPVYSVEVQDTDEAMLLHQQLGLQIYNMEGPIVYFFGTTPSLLDSLKEYGYTPKRTTPSEVQYRVVKVLKKGDEQDLIKVGVQLINREETYWVVRGSLMQLQLLQARGFSITGPDGEPRPREVQVLVKSRADIQRVADLGVDILSVEDAKERGILIYLGAFDYQIDLLRQNNFQVVTVKPYPKGGF